MRPPPPPCRAMPQDFLADLARRRPERARLSCAIRADRCPPCRVRRCGRRASFRTAPARSPDEIATRVATACARTPAPGNAASTPAARSPAGNSQLSPCQCSTGVAPSGASTDLCPAAVSVNGAQPISLTGPGATRAPSAAAIICAPRQMPRIGLFACKARRNGRDFVGDERIGSAHRRRSDRRARSTRSGASSVSAIERLDAGIVIAERRSRARRPADLTAEILEGDVANRQTGFGHGATISSNVIRSESPIFPIMFLQPPIRPAAHRPIA